MIKGTNFKLLDIPQGETVTLRFLDVPPPLELPTYTITCPICDSGIKPEQHVGAKVTATDGTVGYTTLKPSLVAKLTAALDIAVVKSNSKISKMSVRRQKKALAKRPHTILKNCVPMGLPKQIEEDSDVFNVTFSYDFQKDQ